MLTITSKKKRERETIIPYLHYAIPCAHNKPVKATPRHAFLTPINFRA